MYDDQAAQWQQEAQEQRARADKAERERDDLRGKLDRVRDLWEEWGEEAGRFDWYREIGLIVNGPAGVGWRGNDD